MFLESPPKACVQTVNHSLKVAIKENTANSNLLRPPPTASNVVSLIVRLWAFPFFLAIEAEHQSDRHCGWCHKSFRSQYFGLLKSKLDQAIRERHNTYYTVLQHNRATVHKPIEVVDEILCRINSQSNFYNLERKAK